MSLKLAKSLQKQYHGICLMLGSLRTKQSSGIGEYLDLIPLISFCKEVGFNLIQLLPINDSAEDCSPYNTISSLALHPVYLSLNKLPYVENYPELLEEIQNIAPLNEEERINYASVRIAKRKFFKLYFAKVFPLFKNSSAFLHFVKENLWLKEYGLYKTIRETQGNTTWESWPNELKNPTPDLVHHLYEEHANSILYYSFLQYLCHLQLKAVKEFAEKNSIYLKGDIPILISRDSAEVWLYRECFDLRFAVGSPPDMYSLEGQCWGFPPYIWEELEKRHYDFWKKRLKVSSEYFSFYRIDHIIGFFRFWLIAEGKKAREGFYHPGHLETAIDRGKDILQKIVSFSSMFPIGEDLGVIPELMRDALLDLGIPGTKVLRWQKDYEGDKNFIPYSSYPPLSLTTVSTHDSETLTLFWQLYPKDAKELCDFNHLQYEKVLSSETRLKILKIAHTTSSFFHINLFQEYLALFEEFTFKDPHLERINVPGIMLPINWTYRFKATIETFSHHAKLKEAMAFLSQSH